MGPPLIWNFGMSGNISARSAGRKSKNVEGACSRHAPAGHSMSLATTLFYCEVLQFAEPTPTRQDATNNMPMANSSQRKQKNSGKELEGITESEAIPMIRLFIKILRSLATDWRATERNLKEAALIHKDQMLFGDGYQRRFFDFRGRLHIRRVKQKIVKTEHGYQAIPPKGFDS